MIKNKFYHSPDWRKLRNLKIKNSPICEHCLKKGLVVEAKEIDHIIPIKVDESLMLSYDNLQSLCKSCHSKKSMSEKKDRMNPKERNLFEEKMKRLLK